MRRLGDTVTTGLAVRIPLLACLELEQRKRIDALFEVRRYATRETVVWEGDAPEAVFVVLSGYLKACNSGAEGQELLLSVMGPGEVVGELSLLDGQPRSATVVALEAADLAVIDRNSFLRLVDDSPKLALALLGVVTQRLRNLSKRCENVACMNVRGRLAETLLALADRLGKPVGGKIQIPVRLSQNDLGNMVGATRESVNKLLRSWVDTGVLSRVDGRLTITDLQALRAMSAD